MNKNTKKNYDAEATFIVSECQMRLRRSRRVTFLLTNGFDFFSYSAALETLRLANRAADRVLFSYIFISESNGAVTSSIDHPMKVDSGLIELHRDDLLILCTGDRINNDTPKPLIGWLRRQYRIGVEVVSLHMGTILLAKAGLLDGKSATIHWEHFPTLREIFPHVELSHSSICVDGRISTTAGGISSSKRLLQIIERDFGVELKLAIADQLLLCKTSINEDQQRLSAAAWFGTRNSKLIQTISKMETNIEDPIPVRELAKSMDISPRQLERLFKRYLNCSPHQFYLSLRLRKAKTLLQKTNLTVIQIATACGFDSASHFSKRYFKAFGETPYLVIKRTTTQ